MGSHGKKVEIDVIQRNIVTVFVVFGIILIVIRLSFVLISEKFIYKLEAIKLHIIPIIAKIKEKRSIFFILD